MEGREINEQGVERGANRSEGGNLSETWRRDLRSPMRWVETKKVTERDGAALGHAPFQIKITLRPNVHHIFSLLVANSITKWPFGFIFIFF